jgi:CubicO group peptidase (beta-lactamase class C family)
MILCVRVAGAAALAFTAWIATGAVTAASAQGTCSAGEISTAEGCATVDEVKAKIASIVAAGMEANKLKATIAGLAIDGEVIAIEAFGETMTGVPATPDMHFRNGAVAIAYLATVLLQQVEQGVVSLDDTLSKWFPEYPNADAVTLKMLISATSGYPDYVDEMPGPDPFRFWTNDELIAAAFKKPVVCQPGECWSYAHTNFIILGKVLEAATGQSLADLIKAGVVDRLGLKDTRSDVTPFIQEPVLHAFSEDRKIYEESTYWSPSWTIGHGTIMTSNIADMLTSGRAIGEGTLLTPNSHALQFAKDTAKFKAWNEDRYYGLGVFSINGWAVQNPSFSGFAATMAYLPERGIALAVSTTRLPGADGGLNASTPILSAIATYLVPEAPL